ncbi:hypothetical protein LIER_35297 [Lithospermum erythrorhizon]|uniref:Uncharacterized protein n=1 Tax=Lithospermum erythrorhizon TaxID=34254 RepID=A0AAV3NS40_LITER
MLFGLKIPWRLRVIGRDKGMLGATGEGYVWVVDGRGLDRGWACGANDLGCESVDWEGCGLSGSGELGCREVDWEISIGGPREGLGDAVGLVGCGVVVAGPCRMEGWSRSVRNL